MAEGERTKFGWARGGRIGFEQPLDVSDYYHRLGGAFVCASAATGLMQPVTAVTQDIVGWAEVPRAAVPGVVDYYQADTDGLDKCLIISDPTAEYCMPALEDTASVTASMIGRYVSTGFSGSGATWKQLIEANPTSTVTQQQFIVTGVDLINRYVYVRVNPMHIVAN